MRLGERIRERRMELGWTQEELAYRLGVRQTVVCRFELGMVKSPNVVMLRQLARTLKVTTDWLVGMYDEAAEAAAIVVASDAAD
jgi:transcriptional regulator with XRE-family HTH domain